MLRSLNELLGYDLIAKDGQVGKVHNFLFNDEDWTIRYLVVDTGPWIFGRGVLISPNALLQPIWASKSFPVELTREQVKNSPDMDVAQPVSREYEQELYAYYNWPPYWGMNQAAPGPVFHIPPSLFTSKPPSPAEEEQGASHLRSATEVIGYSVQATNGAVGKVKDLLLDDENWQLFYLVIDTDKQLGSDKQVLIALEWIKSINVATKAVSLDLTRHAIQDSPPFDPQAPVNRQYEEVLYDYHGRPKYWQVVERSEQN